MKAFKQILAYAVVGGIAPIVGNAGAVAAQVIAGDPSAHFTVASCIVPAVPAMVATIPAVLGALVTRFVGHQQLPAVK